MKCLASRRRFGNWLFGLDRCIKETIYHLAAKQTTKPPEGKTLVNPYVQIIINDFDTKKSYTNYLVVDNYFMKHSFLGPILEKQLDTITKMRSDSNINI